MMPTVSEKLLQVAQNNPKVYHSGQLNIVKNAECLKNNKSGSAILIDDISPVTHEMGVRVRGKNLFDKSIPYEDYTAAAGGYRLLPIYVGSGFSVTVSLLQKYDIGLGGYFYCVAAGFPQRWMYHNSNTSLCNKSVTLMSEDSYILLVMTVEAYNNFKDEIMVELGTTSTAYTPYVPDLTSVKVSRYGKNIFDISKYIDNEKLFYDEKSHTATFKEDTERIQVSRLFTFLPNINYVISVNNITDNVAIGGRLLNGNYVWLTKDHKYMKVSFSETSNISIDIVKMKTSEVTTESFNGLQFELGSTATEYEPYITPTEYTPNTDGTVNGVTSLYPNTTLMTDTDGVIIDCEYYKDIDKAFDELTTSVALSGGDS